MVRSLNMRTEFPSEILPHFLHHEQWLGEMNMGSNSHQHVFFANHGRGRGRGQSNSNSPASFINLQSNNNREQNSQQSQDRTAGRGGGRASSGRGRSGGRQGQRREGQAGATCQICKKPNHTAEYCWDRYKGIQDESQRVYNPALAALITPQAQTQTSIKQNIAAPHKEERSPSAPDADFGSWILVPQIICNMTLVNFQN